jgi:uncharacterized Zn-binding protein involved in type VI secretion
MPPAARLTDHHTCSHVGGPLVPKCEPTVIIGNRPAARRTDRGACKASHDAIAQGEPSVMFNGEQAARIGDPTRHGGRVVQGDSTVLIGHNTATECLKKAAKDRAAFVKNSDADKQKKPKAKGKDGKAMDTDAAVKHLNAHAHDKSIHRCAQYTREAIEAGGGNVGRTGEARNYGPLLERGGFSRVAGSGDMDSYRPQAGDVAVFQSRVGTDNPGHMQMYNGSRWVSDFRQNSFYPGNGYRGSSVVVYRP